MAPILVRTLALPTVEATRALALIVDAVPERSRTLLAAMGDCVLTVCSEVKSLDSDAAPDFPRRSGFVAPYSICARG